MHDDDDHKAATLLDYVRFLRQNRSYALLFLGEVTIDMPSRFRPPCSCPADALIGDGLIGTFSDAIPPPVFNRPSPPCSISTMVASWWSARKRRCYARLRAV